MIIFNTARLALKLEQVGLQDGPFSISDHADDSLCIMPLATGEWETFVQERGQKTERIVWPDEEAACYGFLGRIAWSHWSPGVPER